MQRRLNEIGDNDWQVIINEEAGLCSPKTLKNAWGFIRSVVEDETGRYPPEVKLPAIAPPDKPFLNSEQIKVFVSAVSETRFIRYTSSVSPLLVTHIGNCRAEQA